MLWITRRRFISVVITVEPASLQQPPITTGTDHAPPPPPQEPKLTLQHVQCILVNIRRKQLFLPKHHLLCSAILVPESPSYASTALAQGKVRSKLRFTLIPWLHFRKCLGGEHPRNRANQVKCIQSFLFLMSRSCRLKKGSEGRECSTL